MEHERRAARGASWSACGGCRRCSGPEDAFSPGLRVLINQSIKKVGEDYERMKYNTAIAQMMTLVNAFYEQGGVSAGDLKALLLLLSPVAPHLCEEIWLAQGFGGYIHEQAWPSYDEAYLVDDAVEIAVQINGRVRARIMVPSDLGREAGEELVRHAQVAPLLEGKQLVKCIYVPGRLLNLVVR